MRSTAITGAIFDGSALNAASFTGSRLTDTRFSAAQARGASFADTELDNVDLAYADLIGAVFVKARAANPELPTSLFLADLKKANLRGSSWVDDQEHRNPPLSAWVCRTTMPDGSVNDRDCPRR